MQERTLELKKSRTLRGKVDGVADLLAKIAEMTDADRILAERLHALVTDCAPDLARRPGTECPPTKDGAVLCFL